MPISRQRVHIGWGGWDRTSASRIQSPMPYHLATPQGAPHIIHALSTKATKFASKRVEAPFKRRKPTQKRIYKKRLESRIWGWRKTA